MSIITERSGFEEAVYSVKMLANYYEIKVEKILNKLLLLAAKGIRSIT